MNVFKRKEGVLGEVDAGKYLKQKGYKILSQNYKNKIGEIDIIAKDGEYLVFVEVKKRSCAEYGLPREAVTSFKQSKIRKVAVCFLKEKGLLDTPCRFDVVDILDDRIEHIIDAF